MRAGSFPREAELLPWVLRALATDQRTPHFEVRLGRKRIDLLLIPLVEAPWVAVELKVRDWKKALWQASINTQLAEKSYVALWHKFVPPALAQRNLFESYGVGIISVSENQAVIVLEGTILHNLTGRRQQLLIEDRLGMD